MPEVVVLLLGRTLPMCRHCLDHQGVCASGRRVLHLEGQVQQAVLDQVQQVVGSVVADPRQSALSSCADTPVK